MRTRAPARALIAFVLLLALGVAPPAGAVSMRGNLSVTPTPDTTMSYASYSIDVFRTGNGETVTGYTLTFPAGTDASGATSPGAGDVVSVAADSRTVTVTLGTPIGQRTNFAVVLDNVRNPATAGTYTIPSVTFYRNLGTQTLSLGVQGQYTIVAAPYLSLTITTPDDGQSVDFGLIDPGVTTSGKAVGLAVTSSAQYTITRFVDGADIELGLSVSGVPVGVLQPAAAVAPASFTDTLTLTPPWTTDPEVPLVATVVYTVTQQP